MSPVWVYNTLQEPLRQWLLRTRGVLPGGREVNLTSEHDEFLRALRDLERGLDQVEDAVKEMRQRIAFLESSAGAGHDLRDSVPMEHSPLLVQLLTQTTELLQSYGNRVRTTEAQALYSEGLTMDEIAQLFGVSRQRVSTLLRNKSGQPPAER
jgi:AraC-like DNA-binding protein